MLAWGLVLLALASPAPERPRLESRLRVPPRLTVGDRFEMTVVVTSPRRSLVTGPLTDSAGVFALGQLVRKTTPRAGLDVSTYRLSLATGSMSAANDYMEMTQLALQAGFPNEARQVVDKGFAAGVLGAGKEAERHKRLRDLVAKKIEEDKQVLPERLAEAQEAKDGTPLVNIGMNLVFNGDKARGLQMMQKGIARDNLKRPDDAKLHLAIAQLSAGDNGKAVATLREVKGNDGTADLARLWSLFARRK